MMRRFFATSIEVYSASAFLFIFSYGLTNHEISAQQKALTVMRHPIEHPTKIDQAKNQSPPTTQKLSISKH
jgi:hypothetical protein